MNNNLGKRIKEYRIANGISQETLAELINKSAPTIRKYENGERNPPLAVVKQISEILNINSSKLIDESNSDSPLELSSNHSGNVQYQINSIVNSTCNLYNKENTLTISELDELQEIITKLILFKLK